MEVSVSIYSNLWSHVGCAAKKICIQTLKSDLMCSTLQPNKRFKYTLVNIFKIKNKKIKNKIQNIFMLLVIRSDVHLLWLIISYRKLYFNLDNDLLPSTFDSSCLMKFGLFKRFQLRIKKKWQGTCELYTHTLSREINHHDLPNLINWKLKKAIISFHFLYGMSNKNCAPESSISAETEGSKNTN